MSKEAQARLRINKLLEESGWVLVETPTQRVNVRVETRVNSNGERGFADYVLHDRNNYPLAVIEAKN
ncbi:MAG: hypothetical protein EBX50_12595, partial [Chitinophagia bacterium]|nr:hypothetical protein [Chitinophagia bacterium]